MNKSEIYDKIIWIYKIPEIILENIVSREKLKNFPSHVKEGLVFKILETLSQYFSVVPDYYYDKIRTDGQTWLSLSSLLPPGCPPAAGRLRRCIRNTLFRIQV